MSTRSCSESFAIARPIDRRRFLGRSAAALAALQRQAPASAAEPAAPRSGRSMTPSAFRDALRGPILSIPTPFTADFQVDLDGVRRMVRKAIDGGIQNVSLTGGNSCYHALSYPEIQ